jgi:hypothetical protein
MVCKVPFPRLYKSVVQLAVQTSVLHVMYKSIAHLPRTAQRVQKQTGSNQKRAIRGCHAKLKILAEKLKLVWVVYVWLV